MGTSGSLKNVCTVALYEWVYGYVRTPARKINGWSAVQKVW